MTAAKSAERPTPRFQRGVAALAITVYVVGAVSVGMSIGGFVYNVRPLCIAGFALMCACALTELAVRSALSARRITMKDDADQGKPGSGHC